MPHIVETCPDDLVSLGTRLDELSADGARIISVVWQTRRVQNDQMSAHDASGSFVIVAERASSLAHPLPRHAPVTAEVAENLSV